MKEIWKNFIKFITSRVFILAVAVMGIFCFMILKLFDLQIVNGEKYQNVLKTSILRELSIPAPRGTIYDRYGRPLAINNVAYSVKIDNSVKIDKDYKNDMYMDLIREIEKNGDNINSIINDLPISTTRPYTFSFGGNVSREVNWKKEIEYTKGIKSGMTAEQINGVLAPVTAEQIMEYLKDKFKVSSKLNDEDARKLVALNYAIYLKRYFQFQPITIALDVSEKTVAILEEKNDKYPGVYIETEALRIYPEKGLFSHILGYTRGMDTKEYSEYKNYIYTTDSSGNTIVEKATTDNKNNSFVYTPNDIIGKTGIERSMEIELRGIDGKKYVEVDPNGRRINTVDIEKEAEPGKKVYLTIDRDLNEVAQNALINELKNTLLLKLDPGSTKNTRITLKELFSSMINANSISIKEILNSAEGSYQYAARNAIFNRESNFELKNDDDMKYAKQMLTDAIQLGELSSKQMILIMHEQKIITGDENFIAGVATGALSPLAVIKDKIINDELTPQDIALDPCSGSVVVTDTNTGKVLAMVTYPTYDNNELVNNFNYEYYKKQEDDPTSPLINRPLRQSKAPGSTFKMITALAGLETGTITRRETILDLSVFEKAGKPTLKCWIYPGSHGYVDVYKALEVSCNYFFNEVAYRMGNATTGNSIESIRTLNKYMELFGLNTFTGVEIGESLPIMATPEYKKIAIENQNPDATSSQTRWTDGNSINTAIGQSFNSYTVATMAKYVATLANGGTRYQMQLVDKIENIDNSIYLKKEANIEEVISLDANNLQAVYDGMLAVTRGTKGSLTTKFKGYPIEVAAKTGTAQESKTRDPHTWFVGFAPFDEPQISIAVMIPFGDVTTYPAAEVAKTVIASYMGLDSKSKTKTMDNMLIK